MLLVHEGGYVNHPKDPAGMTNLGVTKKTYDNYYDTDIDEEGMKQLTKAHHLSTLGSLLRWW